MTFMNKEEKPKGKGAARSIAIDGPSGAGKSSLARALAEALGFVYVDTGAIYRTVGLYVEQQGGDCTNPPEVIALLPDLPVSLQYGADNAQRMYIGERDVTEEIRQNRVSAYAAAVGAIPQVREALLPMQRAIASAYHVIMDGRDIGTVILPKADLKIFLTASPEKRAERRRRELLEKGIEIPLAQLLQEMEARDALDRRRAVAPLQQAPDAVLLDTSELNFAESLQALRAIVKEKLNL